MITRCIIIHSSFKHHRQVNVHVQRGSYSPDLEPTAFAQERSEVGNPLDEKSVCRVVRSGKARAFTYIAFDPVGFWVTQNSFPGPDSVAPPARDFGHALEARRKPPLVGKGSATIQLFLELVGELVRVVGSKSVAIVGLPISAMLCNVRRDLLDIGLREAASPQSRFGNTRLFCWSASARKHPCPCHLSPLMRS